MPVGEAGILVAGEAVQAASKTTRKNTLSFFIVISLWVCHRWLDLDPSLAAVNGLFADNFVYRLI